MKNTDGLSACARTCKNKKVNCHIKECKMWVDYSEDQNCTLIAIYNNDQKPMTLRQVAERLHISFARVKQIETKAFAKLKKHLIDKPY
jgi:DNA-directed RNA polymerase sigma subunit (sigma70/sigma32)